MNKKKLVFVSTLLLTLTALLTSCKVNWFGEQYDAPWWVVAIPVAVLCLIVCVASWRCFTDKTYVCPRCGQKFSPAWWRAAFTIHVNGDRVLKCPHCGKKGFCPLSRDGDA